jgi:hypothetical protein
MRYLILFLFCSNIALAQRIDSIPLPNPNGVSFRGLSVVDAQVLWVTGSKGVVMKSLNGGKTWQSFALKGFENDDFRSIWAFSADEAIIANTKSPGYILKTINGGASWDTVYKNEHPKIFFDAMVFNGNEGFIFSDPIDSTKVKIVRSTDKGQTWKTIANRPYLQDGEYGFAASNSILCRNDSVLYLATGGIRARLWSFHIAMDEWSVINLPLLQGEDSQGCFAMDRSPNGRFIFVGGDYKNTNQRELHCSIGLLRSNLFFKPSQSPLGYRSGVAFVNKSNWVCCGTNGIDISTDDGMNWKSISKSRNVHTVKAIPNSSMAYAIGATKYLYKVAF